MSKLSKEEIISLYRKPYSMTPMEIWKHSNYFNSIATIRRYIQEAIATGEITDEDEDVFRRREEIEKEKKEKRKLQLKTLVLKKVLMCKSRMQISQEIEDETGIETNITEIGKIIEELIQESQLTQEKYKEVLWAIRQNAAKKTALKKQAKRKQKEGLEL